MRGDEANETRVPTLFFNAKERTDGKRYRQLLVRPQSNSFQMKDGHPVARRQEVDKDNVYECGQGEQRRGFCANE